MPPHPTSWKPILRVSSHLRLGLESGLFPSGIPTKYLYYPFLSHILPHDRPSNRALLLAVLTSKKNKWNEDESKAQNKKYIFGFCYQRIGQPNIMTLSNLIKQRLSRDSLSFSPSQQISSTFRVHHGQILVSVLIQTDPVHIIQAYFFNINFNIAVLSTPRYSSEPLNSGLNAKTCINFSSSLLTNAYCVSTSLKLLKPKFSWHFSHLSHPAVIALTNSADRISVGDKVSVWCWSLPVFLVIIWLLVSSVLAFLVVCGRYRYLTA
jgi:hypothetical protein